MLSKLSEVTTKRGGFIFELRHVLPEIEFNYEKRNELIRPIVCERCGIIEVPMDSHWLKILWRIN